MNRRNALRALAVSSPLLLSGCITVIDGAKGDRYSNYGGSPLLKPGHIKHTVLFDLIHEVDSKEAIKFLEDGRRILSALPMVKQFEVFKQISNKCSYSYSFSMVFENRKEYLAYNEHPQHVEFVEKRWNTEVKQFQEADFAAI